MKRKGIYIDLNNIEQVRWFNKIGHKLIKVVRYDSIVETATNETVGYIVTFKSLLSAYVIGRNKKFLNNPVKVILSKGEA